MDDKNDDAARLDWLEDFVRREGEIHLHDGNHPRGIGLSIRYRSLRKAIDDCRAAASIGAADARSGGEGR